MSSLNFKNRFVGCVQYFSYQNNLIWIQVSLSYFNFCYSTSCYVAAVHLELCGKSVLGHSFIFPNFTNITAYFVFD